jgi:hypothetical protein
MLSLRGLRRYPSNGGSDERLDHGRSRIYVLRDIGRPRRRTGSALDCATGNGQIAVGGDFGQAESSLSAIGRAATVAPGEHPQFPLAERQDISLCNRNFHLALCSSTHAITDLKEEAMGPRRKYRFFR